MRKMFWLLAVSTLVACGQSEKSGDHAKHAYSLCPKADVSRTMLYEQVKNFADQQKAQLIDRSAEAQRELAGMEAHVLDKTNGNVILLTVEKPDEFRISVTNLGLREKIALTIRFGDASGEASSVSALMEDLGRFWTVQKVKGGITDDPPC